MAYIYKIINIENNKIYIGKTEHINPNKRFLEHIREAKRKQYKNRPLYSAINKYGEENFLFEIIEETNNPTEREQYWIKYYNSFGENGYNVTLGGEGKISLNHKKIIEDYYIYQNTIKVAILNNCSSQSVRNILKNNRIEIKSSMEVNKKLKSKKVIMFTLKNEFLNSFDSLHDAASYMINNNLTNCKHSTIRSHISEACRGKRKTAAKFKWSFEN